MKLINSITEKKYRDKFMESWEYMQMKENSILSILEENIGNINIAFVISWTPEQFEDLYCIFVNGDIIVRMEIEKKNHKLIYLYTEDILIYEKKLHLNKRKLQFLLRRTW